MGVRSVSVCLQSDYLDPEDHVINKFHGAPPAGFNVSVGKDDKWETILFYYDRDGNFIAWGRMLDEGIFLGRNENLNLICRPADRSLLSWDRRRIRALGFNHYEDWRQYDGSLPTRPDQVWLHHVRTGEEIPVWA